MRRNTNLINLNLQIQFVNPISKESKQMAENLFTCYFLHQKNEVKKILEKKLSLAFMKAHIHHNNSHDVSLNFQNISFFELNVWALNLDNLKLILTLLKASDSDYLTKLMVKQYNQHKKNGISYTVTDEKQENQIKKEKHYNFKRFTTVVKQLKNDIMSYNVNKADDENNTDPKPFRFFEDAIVEKNRIPFFLINDNDPILKDVITAEDIFTIDTNKISDLCRHEIEKYEKIKKTLLLPIIQTHQYKALINPIACNDPDLAKCVYNRLSKIYTINEGELDEVVTLIFYDIYLHLCNDLKEINYSKPLPNDEKWPEKDRRIYLQKYYMSKKEHEAKISKKCNMFVNMITAFYPHKPLQFDIIGLNLEFELGSERHCEPFSYERFKSNICSTEDYRYEKQPVNTTFFAAPKEQKKSVGFYKKTKQLKEKQIHALTLSQFNL